MHSFCLLYLPVQVVLDDLELRSDSLDGLGLPISIEAGYGES